MTELGWFDAHLKMRGAAAKKDVGEALFRVGEIGANDYAYNFMAADSIPPVRIRTMATGSPPSSRFFGGGDPCDGDSLHLLWFRRWWWCCSYDGYALVGLAATMVMNLSLGYNPLQ